MRVRVRARYEALVVGSHAAARLIAQARLPPALPDAAVPLAVEVVPGRARRVRAVHAPAHLGAVARDQYVGRGQLTCLGVASGLRLGLVLGLG